MLKAAVLVAALMACAVVVVVAQHPRHCESPREFEAHAMQWDKKMNFFRRGHFAYDNEKMRTSLFEEVENGTDREYYHTIHLFQEKRAYDFNLKTKVCTERMIPYRWHRIGIPHDAHFVGEAIVGTNAFDGAGLLTTHWEHHNDTEKWSWFGVFSDRSVGCVPVFDHFHDERIGSMRTEFFDVVLGISDPNVFITDQSCPHMSRPIHPTNPLPNIHAARRRGGY